MIMMMTKAALIETWRSRAAPVARPDSMPRLVAASMTTEVPEMLNEGMIVSMKKVWKTRMTFSPMGIDVPAALKHQVNESPCVKYLPSWKTRPASRKTGVPRSMVWMRCCNWSPRMKKTARKTMTATPASRVMRSFFFFMRLLM